LTDWAAVASAIAGATGERFSPGPPQPVGGGSINRGYRLSDGRRTFFLKVNRAGLRAMFEAEADGLRALAATCSLRVPMPVCVGEDAHSSWLVLEHLEIGRCSAEQMAQLGRSLAGLHAAQAPRFGWHRDNTIGSTPQPNGWRDSWPAFWREQRLGFQLELARRNGYGKALREADGLLDAVDALLAGHAPAPSLLHGDLWGGNAGCTVEGEPVVFDPACYYGDREADLAMTALFGGFPRAFYAAYEEAAPLRSRHAVRRELYNLYHVLNHLNLFGGGYLQQAAGMIGRLLSEVR
jgi:fructosamine-3-kinase